MSKQVQTPLQELSVRVLVKLLTELSNGKLGFDPWRDPRTSKKENLLRFILANHKNKAIVQALDKITPQDAPRDPDARMMVVDPALPEIALNEAQVRELAKPFAGLEGYIHQQQMAAMLAASPVYGKFADPEPKKQEKEEMAKKIQADVITPEAEKPAPGVDPRIAALQALLSPQIDASEVSKLVDARVTPRLEEFQRGLTLALVNQDSKIESLIQRKPITEKIIIEQAGKPAVELKGRVNPAFHEILAIANHYPNIMLVGPAGCGKTHLARQVSQALGKSFSSISGSAGISESHFTGRLLPTGAAGKFEYTESPFITEYQKQDGCFLIDEFDALDPNCIMVCQGATANGGFTVEARKAAGLDPYVKRGERALLLASANTYGNGADSLYVGRFQQDAAANDRWYFIPVDYDRDLEAELAPEEVCEWVWSLREKVREHKLKRVVSTRMIQKGAAARAAKRPMKEVKERLLAGWSREERTKCGV